MGTIKQNMTSLSIQTDKVSICTGNILREFDFIFGPKKARPKEKPSDRCGLWVTTVQKNKNGVMGKKGIVQIPFGTIYVIALF